MSKPDPKSEKSKANRDHCIPNYKPQIPKTKRKYKKQKNKNKIRKVNTKVVKCADLTALQMKKCGSIEPIIYDLTRQARSKDRLIFLRWAMPKAECVTQSRPAAVYYGQSGRFANARCFIRVSWTVKLSATLYKLKLPSPSPEPPHVCALSIAVL